jgi:hypothetical protein
MFSMKIILAKNIIWRLAHMKILSAMATTATTTTTKVVASECEKECL